MANHIVSDERLVFIPRNTGQYIIGLVSMLPEFQPVFNYAEEHEIYDDEPGEVRDGTEFHFLFCRENVSENPVFKRTLFVPLAQLRQFQRVALSVVCEIGDEA